MDFKKIFAVLIISVILVMTSFRMSALYSIPSWTQPLLNMTGILFSRTPSRQSNQSKVSNTLIVNRTSNLKKGVLILKPRYQGRLGNYMFLYASVYAFAVSKNMSVYVGDGNRLRKTFRLDPEVVTSQICSHWQPVSAPCCDYDATLDQRIVPDKCQIVGAYLQSWKYFEKYSEAIHRSFRFQPHIEKSAKTKLSFLIQTYTNALKSVKSTNGSKNITLIGIHARRGDYVRLKRKTPPAAYYMKAMEYFRKRFHNPVFLAASDSVSWLKQNLKSKDVIIIGGKKPEEDLCVLSMCNHTIMSVGSFGWWSGYLSGGTTLYYKGMVNDSSIIGRYYKHYTTDYMRKEWIGLE